MIDFKEHFDKINPDYFRSMTDEEFMLAMYHGIMPTHGPVGMLNTMNQIVEREAKLIAQRIDVEIIDELRTLANQEMFK
jgi:hypothetical protein